jgi:hypothetical protein
MPRKKFVPSREVLMKIDSVPTSPIVTGDELVDSIASEWSLSPEVTAGVLGCSVRTLPKLGVSYVRVGNVVRYSKKSLREYVTRVAA